MYKLLLILLLMITTLSCAQEEITVTTVVSSTTPVIAVTTPADSIKILNADKLQSKWAQPVFVNPDTKCKYYKYNDLTKYDVYFKKYTKHYFYLGFDYLFLKAQSIAESNLNPDAKSPVGAQGLMQLMPGTYKDISNKNPELKGNIKDPSINIGSGVYYMGNLWNKWKKKDTWLDHWDFCTSSYNAGMGNIIKAQDLASDYKLNPNIWFSIERTLPDVTGHHSKETIGYVFRIKDIRKCLI